MSWLKRTIKKTGRWINRTKDGKKRTLGGKLWRAATVIQGGVAALGGAALGAKALGAGALLGKAGTGVAALLKGGKAAKSGSAVNRLFGKFAQNRVQTAFTPTNSPTSTTASLLNGSAEGASLMGSFIAADSRVGRIFQKFPSIGEILGGAADGAAETVQSSEVGQEVEAQAVANWQEENMPKILGIALAAMTGLTGLLLLKRK